MYVFGFPFLFWISILTFHCRANSGVLIKSVLNICVESLTRLHYVMSCIANFLTSAMSVFVSHFRRRTYTFIRAMTTTYFIIVASSVIMTGTICECTIMSVAYDDLFWFRSCFRYSPRQMSRDMTKSTKRHFVCANFLRFIALNAVWAHFLGANLRFRLILYIYP